MRALLLSMLALVLMLGDVSGGRVKSALFGGLFGTKSGHGSGHMDSAAADADQAELVQMLRENGFGKYAHKDFIEKLDEEIAYDSIEDMTHLVADDDYNEVGMPHDDAVQIQKLARRVMLKRFLESVPLSSGDAPKLYLDHLDALVAAGYDEPDDVADLEEDEAKGMGLTLEQFKVLVSYAEEYETRLLLHIILTTHVDASGHTPYIGEAAWHPFVDALVKVGVRSLADVAQLTSADVPGVATEDLVALQNDPRVLQHKKKEEL